MKTFKIKLDVPKDFEPGQCEVCPYSNNHDDKRKDFCDLDIHERHLWCILEEIDDGII